VARRKLGNQMVWLADYIPPVFVRASCTSSPTASTGRPHWPKQDGERLPAGQGRRRRPGPLPAPGAGSRPWPSPPRTPNGGTVPWGMSDAGIIGIAPPGRRTARWARAPVQLTVITPGW